MPRRRPSDLRRAELRRRAAERSRGRHGGDAICPRCLDGGHPRNDKKGCPVCQGAGRIAA
jgi:hypothetical protein